MFFGPHTRVRPPHWSPMVPIAPHGSRLDSCQAVLRDTEVLCSPRAPNHAQTMPYEAGVLGRFTISFGQPPHVHATRPHAPSSFSTLRRGWLPLFFRPRRHWSDPRWCSTIRLLRRPACVKKLESRPQWTRRRFPDQMKAGPTTGRGQKNIGKPNPGTFRKFHFLASHSP